MNEIELTVGEEQTIVINNYTIAFHFNPFDREWLFDLTGPDGTVVATNIVMRPNTWPLRSIDSRMGWPRIAMIDKEPNSQTTLNPYTDFGDRLGVFELVEDSYR